MPNQLLNKKMTENVFQISLIRCHLLFTLCTPYCI